MPRYSRKRTSRSSSVARTVRAADVHGRAVSAAPRLPPGHDPLFQGPHHLLGDDLVDARHVSPPRVRVGLVGGVPDQPPFDLPPVRRTHRGRRRTRRMTPKATSGPCGATAGGRAGVPRERSDRALLAGPRRPEDISTAHRMSVSAGPSPCSRGTTSKAGVRGEAPRDSGLRGRGAAGVSPARDRSGPAP